MSDALAKDFRRIGSGRIGVLAAGLLAGAVTVSAMAQTRQDAAPVPGIDALKIRRASDNGLATDLRRKDVPADDAFPTNGKPAPGVSFEEKPKPATDEPDEEDGSADPEDAGPSGTPAPDFDLFEDQDGRPTGPASLAAAPVPSGTAVGGVGGVGNSPAKTAGTGKPKRGGKLRPSKAGGRPVGEDPVPGERNGGPSATGFVLPVGPVRTLRTDSIGGRQNLSVSRLRPTIPIAADDPFAPVGIRTGTFVLYSALEQNLGASTNLSESSDGTGGLFSQTALSARLLSNWSRHEAELNGLFSYRRNFAGELKGEPDVALDGRLRLDVDRLTTATFRGAFEYRQEDPTDLDGSGSAGDRPNVFLSSGSAEFERRFGRVSAALTGAAVRENQTREETGGQLDANFTTYTAGLRTGYEISPAIKPFVQAGIGRRLFDEDVDAEGLERDATVPSLRTGLKFDLGEKLAGEAALGYAWNLPDEDRQEAVGAPTVDGSIAWSPQRGTDVVLTLATNFDPDSDDSGTSTLYQSALALRHRLTARTDLTAALSAGYRDSDHAENVETSYGAETGFTYWLNRTLAFTGLIRHEELDGKQPDSDYTADSIRFGVKLQR